MQGTIEAAKQVIDLGVGINVAGGTYHAFRKYGEAFCLFNDLAIAANFILEHRLAHKVAIVDLDVHQGNGTAHNFSGSSQVFTFSMHGASNYPLVKQHSSLDVPLPDGCEDREYLYQLSVHLDYIFQTFCPDFILYQAGVDVWHTDKLGRLALTMSGLSERDRLVIHAAHSARTPICITLGGGYSPSLATVVYAHMHVFRWSQYYYG